MASPAPFPQPDHWPTKDEILAEIDAQSKDWGAARPLARALAYAESGENLTGLERWWTLTAEAQRAIVGGDRSRLQAVLDQIAAAGSDDISFGPYQQTWRWWSGYPGEPFRYDMDKILIFRAQMIGNVQYAVSYALEQLNLLWMHYAPDMLETLSRYNKPDGSASQAVRARYAQMLQKATTELSGGAIGQPPPSGPISSSPRFQLGLAALADYLGADVVGEPLTDEQYIGNDWSYQYTTTGKMEYSKTANVAYFIPARTLPRAAPAPPSVAVADLRGKLPTRPGADPYPKRDVSQVTGVKIHYTASPSSGTVEGIARYQTGPGAQEDFPAIAYHLVVDGQGTVNLCNDLDRRVWHDGQPGANETTVGICYIGNDQPNPQQLAGLKAAIVYCQQQLGRTLAVSGHKDGYATECPGPYWPGWKSQIVP